MVKGKNKNIHRIHDACCEFHIREERRPSSSRPFVRGKRVRQSSVASRSRGNAEPGSRSVRGPRFARRLAGAGVLGT